MRVFSSTFRSEYFLQENLSLTTSLKSMVVYSYRLNEREFGYIIQVMTPDLINKKMRQSLDIGLQR